MTGTQRPPEPEAKGFEYVAVPDPEWQIAPEGTRCRWTGPGQKACGEPAVIQGPRGNDLLSPWDPRCAAHAARRLRWAEDGKVMRWDKRRVPRPAGDAAPRRKVHSLRMWEPTLCDLEDAVAAGQAPSATAFINEATEAALGYARCNKGHAVQVTLGNHEGMTLREAIDVAARAVRRQRCENHEPVLVGSQAAAEPPAAPAVRDTAAAREEPPAARPEASAPVQDRPAVLAAVRQRAADTGAPLVPASELPGVPPGSIRFVPIDPEPNLPAPVLAPEIPASRAKKGRAKTAKCIHDRVRPGTWCKICQAVKA